jgi:CheY-like chemotaxis protein
MHQGEPRRANQPTVLVVDDTEVLRDLIADVLALEGYRVITAADGVEALDRLGEGRRPCVILMDLAMPRMDGFELAAHVRAEPEWESIPIVVLSALLPGKTVPDAAAHLAKPVPMNELLETIAAHCGAKASGRRESEARPRCNTPEPLRAAMAPGRQPAAALSSSHPQAARRSRPAAARRDG